MEGTALCGSTGMPRLACSGVNIGIRRSAAFCLKDHCATRRRPRKRKVERGIQSEIKQREPATATKKLGSLVCNFGFRASTSKSERKDHVSRFAAACLAGPPTATAGGRVSRFGLPELAIPARESPDHPEHGFPSTLLRQVQVLT